MTKEIRCLIVDDEPKNVKTLSKRLDSLGHKYEVAQDQRSALNFIKRKGKGFHYVLLDLKLKVDGNDNDPDSSTGYSLLRQVREILPKDRLPILVITAYEGNVKTAVEVMKIGANDFIVRDSPQKDLINKILAMLDHKGSNNGKNPPRMSTTRSTIILEIDETRPNVIIYRGQKVDLTKTEHDFMVYMGKNSDRELRNDAIISGVWGDKNIETQRINSIRDGINKKIKEKFPQFDSKNFIKNLRGSGWKLNVPKQQVKFVAATELVA